MRPNSISRKTTTKLTVIGSVIGALIFFGYYSYNNNINTPVDITDDTQISFQIKKGTPPKEITENLETEGLIPDSFSLYIHLKLNDLGENIIAGRFLLDKTMTAKEIITVISDPASGEFVITVQEGLTIKDIDAKLVELQLTQPNDFITAVKNFDGWEYYSFLEKETLSKLEIPLEGYLYPDTYFLDAADFQPDDLIYLSLDNFELKTADLLPELKNHTTHEIITMASIIENEVFGVEDRKQVSGILWKRLDFNWTLGADATLLYITDDREIDSEDLELDSPYNTRKNLGLPPGPISNPSVESIEAAMYPTENDYWFYLTTLDTGEVIYANSNEEHNINKSKYL
jgi:peptidoglycan lytic transglycosylase G